MLKPFIPLLILSFSWTGTISSALAGEDDFSQPITVDSKNQFLDGKKKSSIFKGDVNITQGSLLISADEVEVNASLGEGKEVIIARGQPASYSQLLDDGQKVQASANEIKYEVSNRTISLNGEAKAQRDTTSVSGNSIVYDMVSEQFFAQGDKDEDSRVTTVFRPEAIKQLSESEKKDNKDKDDEDKPSS